MEKGDIFWKIRNLLVFKMMKLVLKMPKLVFRMPKLVSPAFYLQGLGWISHKKKPVSPL